MYLDSMFVVYNTLHCFPIKLFHEQNHLQIYREQ